MKNIFLNPEFDFEFVSDSILWDKIFCSPVPVEFNKAKSPSINLSKFFEVNEAFIDSNKGYLVKRKLLIAKECFYNKDPERDLAFQGLCNFLIRYNRPFRDCYISVPNHPEVEKREEYLPADIYYKKPQFPLLNEKKDRLRLDLYPSFFKELYKYCFGCEYDLRVITDDSCSLDFSFECFCGFILHY